MCADGLTRLQAVVRRAAAAAVPEAREAVERTVPVHWSETEVPAEIGARSESVRDAGEAGGMDDGGRRGWRCAVDGCERPIESGELCSAHRKRRQRGQPLAGPIRERNQPPKERLTAAALAYAAAETEEDFHAAERRLMQAAQAIGKGSGGG